MNPARPRLSVGTPWALGLLAAFHATSLLGQTSASPGQPPIAVTCNTDHADATYRVGETVTFTIAASQGGRPIPGQLDWSLSKDGVAPFFHGTTALTDGQATVTGKLSEPGFLQCKADVKTASATVRGVGGAAVDPLSIGPSLPVPDDFDSFWSSKKAELAQVPIHLRMTPVSTGKYPGVDLFEVQADAVGKMPMSGYYARPQHAAAQSAPAIILLEGAGVYGTRLEPWLMRFAREGFLALELNAHGLPSGQPDAFYQALEKGALKDYQFFGRQSRETSYFLDMYLRDLRGVDFLTAQPEWNGHDLVAFGASQGGAQAIAVTAEDPRVTFLAAAVPAMSDHSGMVVGRVPGWPRLVPIGADGKPDAAVLQASRYFDSVNFATRVRVPAVFAVGFIDMIAPPTSVYAAYNRVPTAKQMIPAIHSPHKLGPETLELFHRAVLEHVTTKS